MPQKSPAKIRQNINNSVKSWTIVWTGANTVVTGK